MTAVRAEHFSRIKEKNVGFSDPLAPFVGTDARAQLHEQETNAALFFLVVSLIQVIFFCYWVEVVHTFHFLSLVGFKVKFGMHFFFLFKY